MAAELVRVAVSDVWLAVPAGAGVEAGMVELTETEPPRRMLRIVIGQAEARAISAAWGAAVPSRPSTWDLFVSAVAVLDGRLDRVVITAVQDGRHFFANIEIDQHGQRRILACRPSDAVALGLRAYGAAIFAEEDVLAEAGVLADGTRPGRVERAAHPPGNAAGPSSPDEAPPSPTDGA